MTTLSDAALNKKIDILIIRKGEPVISGESWIFRKLTAGERKTLSTGEFPFRKFRETDKYYFVEMMRENEFLGYVVRIKRGWKDFAWSLIR